MSFLIPRLSLIKNTEILQRVVREFFDSPVYVFMKLNMFLVP